MRLWIGSSQCDHKASGRLVYFASVTMIVFMASGLPPSSRPEAADWLVQGRGALGTEYDSNVFLNPDDEVSVVGVTVSPEIDIGGRSQIWDVFLTTRLDFARFTEEDTVDSEDVTVSLDSSYRTQLGEWALEGAFKRLNTRTSEITDSGRLDSEATRLEYELLPSWTYTLTPRNKIFVRGGWNQAFFDEATLDDFTEYSAGGGWNYQLTQRDDITLSGFFSHFENDDVGGNETDVFGGQAEWHRVFSKRLETRIAVGPRYATTDRATRIGPFVITDSESSLGFVVSGSIDYDVDERTTLSGTLSRDVEPSSIGEAVERDRLDLSIRHFLEPLIRISLSTNYVENRDPNDEDRVSDRDYFSVTPAIRWEFERDWYLSARYRFRTQEFEGADRAYSNAAFVTVSHSLQPWRFAD